MINIEPVFERVKYNALDYIGLYETPVSDLGSILATVVAENLGDEVFFDTQRLTESMENAGASKFDIHSVCIMTQVTGFREILRRDPRTAQIDLDRYIQNATEETGFNRETILRLTSSIAYATGIAMNYDTRSKVHSDVTTDTVATLASSVCQSELNKFKESFEKVIIKKSSSVQLDFDSLEPLVNVGIPKAKYYLGYCLLKGIQLEENEERGVELLREAADAGDSKAAAVLGDYYFEQGGSSNWTKAYEYYTGFGSAALSKTRKSAIVSILNHKLYNKKILGLCIALFIALVATVVWAPATSLYAVRPFWGWLAIIIQLGLLVLKVMHYRVKPYDCVYTLPVAMFGVWFVYMAIRLLF